ncbi:MAG: porin [Phycisphaerales bacterium]|nr:porin [Phycisphaerales bacterium]
MFYRNAVLAAVASILATAGLVKAESAPLSLTAAAAPADEISSGLLMQGLDQLGAGGMLKDAGLKIYGWLEVGYTYNHRHNRSSFIVPGPFNHQVDNHLMLNQFVLRIEREVATDKFDVGGMIEFMYGTDAAGIHANGFGLGFSGEGGRFNPQYQPDFVQVYADVNLPIANGLKLRAGKFASFMSYETIDPRGNPFYSHSYLFASLPATFTGLVGFFNVNEQLAVMGGITRGWNQALQDNNGAINVIGQVKYAYDKQWDGVFNITVGPENPNNSSHYRTTLNAIVNFKATEQLKFGAEALYIYDGGMAGDPEDGVSRGYGDVWGATIYASYEIDQYMTANARLGFFHYSAGAAGHVFSNAVEGAGDIFEDFEDTFGDNNILDLTLGVTIKPFPKDNIGKNLTIRPEIRYSISEDRIFFDGNNRFSKEQFSIGADVIFTF